MDCKRLPRPGRTELLPRDTVPSAAGWTGAKEGLDSVGRGWPSSIRYVMDRGVVVKGQHEDGVAIRQATLGGLTGGYWCLTQPGVEGCSCPFTATTNIPLCIHSGSGPKKELNRSETPGVHEVLFKRRSKADA